MWVVFQARDPIPQFKKYALEAGLIQESELKDIEKKVLAEVDEAVKFADESPKPVSAPHALTVHMVLLLFVCDPEQLFSHSRPLPSNQ